MNSRRIGILLILFVLASLAGGTYLYLNDSRVRFAKLLNREYKSFTTMLDNFQNSKIATLSKGTTISTSSDISFNVSLNNEIFGDSINNIVDTINHLGINLQYASDNTNGNTVVKFASKLDNNKFLSANLFQTDKEKYLYLDGIYDKYIQSNSSSLISNPSDQTEDITYLVNVIKRTIILSLKSSDFTDEKATITINNQQLATTKTTLTITNKRLVEITKDVLNTLKNDSKCLSILKNLSGSTEDMKTSIDKTIKSLDDEPQLTDDAKFVLYTANNELVKVEVFDGKTKNFEYLNYRNSSNRVRVITICDNDDIILSASFEEFSPNDISFKIDLSNSQLVLNGMLSNTTTETKTNETWNTEIKFSLSAISNGTSIGTVKINANTTTKLGAKLDTINITNSINENDLSEKEKSDILSKIFTKILNIIPLPKVEETASGEEVF